jgi:hypothetical protein
MYEQLTDITRLSRKPLTDKKILFNLSLQLYLIDSDFIKYTLRRTEISLKLSLI